MPKQSPSRKIIYTYLHRKADTGEVFYVGKGSGERLYGANQRSRFWSSIVAKHGFTAEIASIWPSHADAFVHEALLIKQYRSEGVSLCNLTDGGDGGVGRQIPPEERILRSEIQKMVWERPGFRTNHTAKTVGQKRSEESRRKMSVARTGMVMSEITRQRMSEGQRIANNLPWRKEFNSNLHKGRKASPETRARISLTKTGANNVRSKKVICADTGVVFESTGCAVRWLISIGKVRASCAAVSRVCYGKKKTAYGFRWSFANGVDYPASVSA